MRGDLGDFIALGGNNTDADCRALMVTPWM